MKLPALQTKITGVALATLLGATPALAIDINPTLDLSGYIVGSARYVDQDGSDTTLDLDATKLLASIKTDPVSGTVSFFSAGTDDVSILDAYFTYDMGGGTTITAGKFLSYYGYESFDIPNMLQITYSNDNILPIIPGYHKGIRIDVSQGATKMGVALLDSVYDSDGEIEDGFGIESYYVYSNDSLTTFFGLAYENDGFGLVGFDVDGDPLFDSFDSWLANFWVQYSMGSTTLAGELAYRSTDSDAFGDVESYFVSGLVQFEMSEGNFAVVRVSYGEDDFDTGGSEDFIKGTLAFRQKISDNFTVVEEISYTSYDIRDSQTFIGVQGRFTF